MIENGHKTIAFAGGPAESAIEISRKSGYMKAIKEFGINVINLIFDRIEGKYSGIPREILIPRVLIPRDSEKNINI